MIEMNYNPMENFNMVYNDNMGEINASSNKIEGGVSVNIPSDKIENDPQLKEDLGKITFTSDDGAGKLSQKFSDALANSMGELNNLQRGAEKAVETFATGGDIDVHSVMIASQKAQMSLNLAMQLRNKAVQAYSEISRMNI